MKIWIKYFLGCGLGILAAIILPFESQSSQKVINLLSEFALRFGRYTLLPLLFFSMTISICNLRDDKSLIKIALQTFILACLSSLLLMLLGLISSLIIRLPRIPISGEKISSIVTLNLADYFLRLFPYSSFEVFHDGAFLVPLYILAGFAGAGFSSDRTISKPAYTLFDSLSHVCYTIMTFFVDMLAIGLIAISCTWTLSFISALKTGVYTGFLLMLLIDFILVVFVLYPIILRFAFKELHPFKILYACIASSIISFFSGDSNLSLLINIKHAKESLGIRRRITTISLPIFSSFSRGGAACMITISFIIILRSYSGLGIAFTDVIWIGFLSFILSFMLSALPVGGPFIALTVLCSLYGRGFDAGYLLLKPVAPVICSIAATIDTITALLGTYLIATKNKLIDKKDYHKYI